METTVQTEQSFLNIDGAQIEKERQNLSSAHLLFLASRSLTLFYTKVLDYCFIGVKEFVTLTHGNKKCLLPQRVYQSTLLM